MTQSENETKLSAIRSAARTQLMNGQDYSAVVFAISRDASRAGLGESATRSIVADLRAEGLIPDSEERSVNGA